MLTVPGVGSRAGPCCRHSNHGGAAVERVEMDRSIPSFVVYSYVPSIEENRA